MRYLVVTLALLTVCGGTATVSCARDDVFIPFADAGDDAASGADDGGLATPAPIAQGASIALSVDQIDFSTVACGASAATSALTLHNGGSKPVGVSASTTGAAFAVNPAVFTLDTGATATLTLTTNVPTSATAGVPIVGTLSLSIGASNQASFDVPLSVTPSGASLAFAQGEPSTFAFPLTEVGYLASLGVTLVNAGNASATFTVGAPSDPRFSLGGTTEVTLAAGEPWPMQSSFAATDTSVVRASASITATGTLCSRSLAAVTFSARATTGESAGWPALVDFGPADCGGSAPSERSFTITNSATVDAHLTAVTLAGAPGFTTNAKVGRAIFANGGSLDITVDAPAVPALASAEPITATLLIATDADSSPHEITLTEEPNGAILAFDTSGAPNFGSFGAVPLLGSVAQVFGVVNTGTAAASVTLVTTPSPTFTVSSPAFAIAGNGSQSEMAVFAPRSGGTSTGSIAMTATGALCSPLPAPIPLSGVSGAAPNVSPTSLAFAAECGRAAPASQTFLIENGGNANMNWTLGSVTGAGAGKYSLSANPPPGLLAPGASAIVTVTATAIPSPTTLTDPSSFAAQVVVTTDVPFDPPHVVTLGETPLGDQLSFGSSSPLRFGQLPIGTELTQGITMVNAANAGSDPPALSFTLHGSGAQAYAIAPGSATSVEDVTFAPAAATSYPATLTVTTSDALCTPLPPPLQLTGAGTAAATELSATTLAFGTDPGDPNGFVSCGATGLAQTLTVSNAGNQGLHVTALTFGAGASSYFGFAGAGPALPLAIPIAGSTTLVVTPRAIPATVSNPNDASPFVDTLTVTTDAPLDAPHVVQLVMQARGAVIADTPLSAAWTFGAVSPGAIATITTAVENTGNAAASVALHGVLQPSIFGLRSNPTTVAANGTTSIVAQFIPPSASGSWSDQGSIAVTALDGLCAPLPSQWTNPVIPMAGHSP